MPVVGLTRRSRAEAVDAEGRATESEGGNRMTNTTDTGFARTLVAGLTLVVPFLVVLGSWLLLRERLPAELASHWSGVGRADGVMPVAGSLTISLVMTGLAATAGIVIASRPGMSASLRRGGFFFAGFFAGIGMATWLLSAGLTPAAGDPFDAVLGGWIVLLVAAAGYGVIPFLIAPKPIHAGVDRFRGDQVPLEPSGARAWSCTVTSTVFIWVTAALIIIGVVICAASIIAGNAGDSVIGVVAIAATTLVVAAFIRLRVSVDARGLSVVSAVMRIPVKRIGLEQIAAVEAVSVLQPMEWGGWGFRVTSGRSALILKKGPGLVVTTTRDTQFAITLPDPHTPAAVLAALRDDASNVA